ncbi:hypothetical protein [Massilia sp. ST3]|uniref:hypothetical protein n=1 Tax=Massilia sp. ST3 TaxID=2824903 RepID=UPI001B8413E9|nr:hypothetical protein [Massilia sp. ST3]MBQ5946794.1 hypothetical protein [Massilia sp. ST3]
MTGLSPRFPISVTWDDGDIWEFNDLRQAANTLEFFDSNDKASATVVDADGRPVRIVVQELEILKFAWKTGPVKDSLASKRCASLGDAR